jgi:hypothetical protein
MTFVLVTADSAPFTKGQAATLLRRKLNNVDGIERLEVIDLTQNMRGVIPKECVQVIESFDLVPFICLHDFDVSSIKDSTDTSRFLPFRRNDIVFVFNSSGKRDLRTVALIRDSADANWFAAIGGGRFGLCPATYLQPSPAKTAPAPALTRTSNSTSSSNLLLTGTSAATPPASTGRQLNEDEMAAVAVEGRRRSASNPMLPNADMIARIEANNRMLKVGQPNEHRRKSGDKEKPEKKTHRPQTLAPTPPPVHHSSGSDIVHDRAPLASPPLTSTSAESARASPREGASPRKAPSEKQQRKRSNTLKSTTAPNLAPHDTPPPTPVVSPSTSTDALSSSVPLALARAVGSRQQRTAADREMALEARERACDERERELDARQQRLAAWEKRLRDAEASAAVFGSSSSSSSSSSSTLVAASTAQQQPPPPPPHALVAPPPPLPVPVDATDASSAADASEKRASLQASWQASLNVAPPSRNTNSLAPPQLPPQPGAQGRCACAPTRMARSYQIHRPARWLGR